MKRIFLSILTIMLSMATYAQSISNIYCNSVDVLRKWKYNSDRSYSIDNSNILSSFNGSIAVKDIYSYDKKKAKVYLVYNNTNCVFNLTDDCNKAFKKQIKEYNIPNLKEDELFAKEHAINDKIDSYFNHLNDSITDVKREEERIAREEALQKAREDSIRLDNYRRNHDWHKYNYDFTLYCEECGEAHSEDSVIVLNMSNDSICYMRYDSDSKLLGLWLSLFHFSRISDKMKSNSHFKEYCTIWKDSIASHEYYGREMIKAMNTLQWSEHFDKIKQKAPNGFIKDWGWELNSAAGIEPWFEYTNTNDKTIKYVDFYFSVNNAVGDVCNIRGEGRVAHVRGVGPVEPFETASWHWERASHYTSYDASNMQVVKLVVTYMNGTVKTIPKAQVIFE